MKIAVQVSIYPLGQEAFIPVIKEAIARLESSGLQVERTAMSTIISGDESAVFALLRQTFLAAAEHGITIMVATLAKA